MTIIRADAIPSVAGEIANGDEIGTAQLARERKLEISTIFRWIIKGLPGATGDRVHLAAIKRGKTWLTSRAALGRFFSALPNSADLPGPPRSVSCSPVRDREKDDAKAQLRDRFDLT